MTSFVFISQRRLGWAAAILALLAFSPASQAQQDPINGAIGGAAQGNYEGKQAAGPIGGLVGGALGAGVGAVTGTLNGVLGPGPAVRTDPGPDSPMPPPPGTAYDSGRR